MTLSYRIDQFLSKFNYSSLLRDHRVSIFSNSYYGILRANRNEQSLSLYIIYFIYIYIFFLSFFFHRFLITMRGQEDESVRRTPTRNELSISSSPSNIKGRNERSYYMNAWARRMQHCFNINGSAKDSRPIFRWRAAKDSN